MDRSSRQRAKSAMTTKSKVHKKIARGESKFTRRTKFSSEKVDLDIELDIKFITSILQCKFEFDIIKCINHLKFNLLSKKELYFQ